MKLKHHYLLLAANRSSMSSKNGLGFDAILKGSSTVEVLVGAVLIATVVTALLSLMTANLKNSSEAVYREVATRVAQDGIELMRGQIALTSWNDFKVAHPLPPPPPSPAPAPPADVGTLTEFSGHNCTATVTPMGTSFVRSCTADCYTDAATCTITSKVTWNPWNAATPKTLILQQKIYAL